MKQKIALCLRGHLRNSFDNNDLIKFIDLLNKNFNLDIFIQTWNENEAKLSWRNLDRSKLKQIDELYIKQLFNNFEKNIKHIMILDDSNIELVGELTGNLGGIPKIAWKNMWYGIYNIIDFIKNYSVLNKIEYYTIINMRFDLFTYYNSPSLNLDINKMIKKLLNINNPKLTFLYNEPKVGVDNYYFGSIENMYKLSNYFHFNLDIVQKKYNSVYNQEKLVYMIANDLNIVKK